MRRLAGFLGALLLLQAIGHPVHAKTTTRQGYAFAILVGDDDPDAVLPRWKQHPITFRATYVGSGTIADRFPKFTPARSWIENEFNENAKLPLTVVTAEEAAVPAIDVLNPVVDLLVFDGNAPFRLNELVVHNDQGTERTISRGLFNCELIRWQHGADIVKAVGVLYLTSDTATNVKCVSMTLLFAVGLNVTTRHFKPGSASGVMTSYYLEPSEMILPAGVDTAIIRILYSNSLPAGVTKEGALEAILDSP